MISDEIFEKTIIENRQPSVLVFGAEWSGNSEMMDSMMERVSREFDEKVQFFKVDLEEQAEISKFFGVYTVPTTIMLKDGEVVEFLKGFVPAGKIRKKIEEIFF